MADSSRTRQKRVGEAEVYTQTDENQRAEIGKTECQEEGVCRMKVSRAALNYTVEEGGLAMQVS